MTVFSLRIFWDIKQVYIIVDTSFYYFTSMYSFWITPCEFDLIYSLNLDLFFFIYILGYFYEGFNLNYYFQMQKNERFLK